MITKEFKISDELLNELIKKFPNLGKNSDVGKYAVEVVKEYFKQINKDVTFKENQNGVDLEVNFQSIIEKYEIKGTADPDIAWAKLKVSSQKCYDELVNGLILLRVTNIGQKDVCLHFMKHDEDFLLIPEHRWRLTKKII